MKQVGDAAQGAVLGNEGAPGTPVEEGVDRGMVVEEEVDGGASAEGSEGEGTVGSKELCGLLGYDPRQTWEEAGAHGVFPYAHKVCAIGCPGGISKETG